MKSMDWVWQRRGENFSLSGWIRESPLAMPFSFACWYIDNICQRSECLRQKEEICTSNSLVRLSGCLLHCTSISLVRLSGCLLHCTSVSLVRLSGCLLHCTSVSLVRLSGCHLPSSSSSVVGLFVWFSTFSIIFTGKNVWLSSTFSVIVVIMGNF